MKGKQVCSSEEPLRFENRDYSMIFFILINVLLACLLIETVSQVSDEAHEPLVYGFEEFYEHFNLIFFDELYPDFIAQIVSQVYIYMHNLCNSGCRCQKRRGCIFSFNVQE